jgi:response regulator RpfG family c-di-GMP phosphodiesterase
VALSQEIAVRMGFNHKQLVQLEMAARLRDIGLCAVPYSLVNDKPFSEWTDADTALYERHPEVGAAMLELAPSLSHLSLIVRSHQARFDGGSGPFFPSWENIPIEARLLKVVSDFLWLERTQGTLLAKTTLRDGAGTVYDPELVYKLLALISTSRVAESPVASVTV